MKKANNTLLASSRASRNALSNLSAKPIRQAGLGIYVHWPYCARICPYCDFNRYLAKSDEINHQRLANCYVKELTTFRRFLEDGDPTILGMEKPLVPLERQEDRRRKVRSVFFGGGTPSLAKVRPLVFSKRCELLWLRKSSNTGVLAHTAPSDGDDLAVH